MITELVSYRDDKGRLEVEVRLDGSGDVLRTFIVEESDVYVGSLTFTALSADPPPRRDSY